MNISKIKAFLVFFQRSMIHSKGLYSGSLLSFMFWARRQVPALFILLLRDSGEVLCPEQMLVRASVGTNVSALGSQ